jgi:hypothetical protein
MFLEQSTIVGHNEGYCNTYIGVLYKTPCVDSFWFMLFEWYCSWSKGWSEIVVPLLQYLKNAKWIVIYILTINMVLHNPTKNLKGNQYPSWGIP